MSCLVAYCRTGFEGECAAELQACAAERDVAGYVRAKPGSGYVVFTAYEPGAAELVARRLDFRTLVFARQLFLSGGLLKDLPVTDRVTPLLFALRGHCSQVSGLWVETADTSEAKELLVFCRKFAPALRRASEETEFLDPTDPALPRAHVFFLGSSAAYPGISDPSNSSPWFMGIPRLKCPRDAPSRATMKLEEAFHVFLTAEQRAERLRPGMRAVDLGAAPGGWTWQFVRRGIRVTAVDNGALVSALLDSGLVEHMRADGFRYAPQRPVDWMVCDMVEQPRRIAELVARWLAHGWCRECIFNLKLPMKKRFDEVRFCAGIIREELEQAGVPYRLAFKQLYHDREEVTGYLHRTG